MSALCAFFLFGAVMSALAAATLAVPGTVLDEVWRLNPDARQALGMLGVWAVVLMCCVSAVCALSATGLWRLQRWGRSLAIAVLGINLIGDTLNAILRADPRTLIGLPIGAALIMYLSSRRMRKRFAAVATSPAASPARPCP